MSTDQQFVARIKARAKRVPVTGEPVSRFSRLLVALGWSFVVSGLTMILIFLTTIEAIFIQFGGYEAVAVINNLSGSGFNEILEPLGLMSIVQFVKIYEVRWLIALGLAAFFGILAALSFMAGKRKTQ